MSEAVQTVRKLSSAEMDYVDAAFIAVEQYRVQKTSVKWSDWDKMESESAAFFKRISELEDLTGPNLNQEEFKSHVDLWQKNWIEVLKRREFLRKEGRKNARKRKQDVP